MNHNSSSIDPMKEGHPEPFSEPRTMPKGWRFMADLEAGSPANGDQAVQATYADDSDPEMPLDTFPKLRTMPEGWDMTGYVKDQNGMA